MKNCSHNHSFSQYQFLFQTNATKGSFLIIWIFLSTTVHLFHHHTYCGLPTAQCTLWTSNAYTSSVITQFSIYSIFHKKVSRSHLPRPRPIQGLCVNSLESLQLILLVSMVDTDFNKCVGLWQPDNVFINTNIFQNNMYYEKCCLYDATDKLHPLQLVPMHTLNPHYLGWWRSSASCFEKLVPWRHELSSVSLINVNVFLPFYLYCPGAPSTVFTPFC